MGRCLYFSGLLNLSLSLSLSLSPSLPLSLPLSLLSPTTSTSPLLPSLSPLYVQFAVGSIPPSLYQLSLVIVLVPVHLDQGLNCSCSDLMPCLLSTAPRGPHTFGVLITKSIMLMRSYIMKMVMQTAGLELTTFRTWSKFPNHYATMTTQE